VLKMLEELNQDASKDCDHTFPLDFSILNV
jgi:hypothetical protein